MDFVFSFGRTEKNSHLAVSWKHLSTTRGTAWGNFLPFGLIQRQHDDFINLQLYTSHRASICGAQSSAALIKAHVYLGGKNTGTWKGTRFKTSTTEMERGGKLDKGIDAKWNLKCAHACVHVRSLEQVFHKCLIQLYSAELLTVCYQGVYYYLSRCTCAFDNISFLIFFFPKVQGVLIFSLTTRFSFQFILFAH